MFAVSILRPPACTHARKRTCKPEGDRAGVRHQLWARMVSELAEWRRRLRDRRALAAMSDRSLRDIGVTRYDALQEANKPFWRE